MIRKIVPLAATFLFLGLLLIACDSEAQDTQATEPAALASGEELTSPAETAVEESQSGNEDPATENDLPDLGGREITIAVENAYLPFNYIDPETAEPAGWDYAVWNEICSLINCRPVFIETGWASMIQAVADGQFDAAANGIAINEERKKIVDYSDFYMTIDQRLLVRLDETNIERIEDIVADQGLKLSAQTGTKNYDTVTAYLAEERIQTVEQLPYAVQNLIAGETDAVIIDEVAGQGYKGANADVLKLVGPPITSEQLGFVYPKDSDLVEPVNAALSALKANGFLQRINAQYFGPEFDITHEDLY